MRCLGALVLMTVGFYVGLTLSTPAAFVGALVGLAVFAVWRRGFVRGLLDPGLPKVAADNTIPCPECGGSGRKAEGYSEIRWVKCSAGCSRGRIPAPNHMRRF
ncbi:hypothetical protein [Streptomyces sp. NPDC002952]|uniref:hypothetical protein n=1 Tax=Streptomyces sp. NPDC002952 TaxID=3364673 RepID=UPI00369025E5